MKRTISNPEVKAYCVTWNKKKNDKSFDSIEKETEDEIICWSSDEDEDIPLREGDMVVGQWSF